MSDSVHTPRHLCDPSRHRRLLDPVYRLVDQPAQLLEEMGIVPGMRVADMGCGPGFFTLPLLDLVSPGGCVAAVELQDLMLDALREELAGEDLPEGLLEIHHGNLNHTDLSDHAWDAALYAFTLHEVEPLAALREARRILKPEGRLLVMEWGHGDCPVRNDGRRAGPPMDHRLLPPALDAALTQCGFVRTAGGVRLGGCQYWAAAVPG
ncbi:MAG: methyltransferase domain-containing protein [Magnetococcus sp. WYHC-3]